MSYNIIVTFDWNITDGSNVTKLNDFIVTYFEYGTALFSYSIFTNLIQFFPHSNNNMHVTYKR